MNKDRLNMINEMLEKNPKDSFLNYAAALEYKKYGQLDKAIAILAHLISFDPDYLGTYYQLGKMYEEKGETGQAVAIYKAGRAVAKEQNDSKTLGELSEALMILDEDDEEAW